MLYPVWVDHPIVRQGLKQVLADTDDIVIVGEAQNARETIEQIRKHVSDVLILDISMPGKSSLDLLKQLRFEYPKLPVLVLTIHPENQFAVRVLKAGAAGYLTKETGPKEIIKAIRKVAQGGKYRSPSLAETISPRPGNAD